jgi:hypothetical protein
MMLQLSFFIIIECKIIHVGNIYNLRVIPNKTSAKFALPEARTTHGLPVT